MAFWYVALTSLLVLLQCWSGTATSSVPPTISNGSTKILLLGTTAQFPTNTPEKMNGNATDSSISDVSSATVSSSPPPSTTSQATVVITVLQTVDATTDTDQGRDSPSPQTQSTSSLDMTSNPKSPATVPLSPPDFGNSTPDASIMGVSETAIVTDSIPDMNVTEAALSSSQPRSRRYVTPDISTVTNMALTASVFTTPVIIVIALGCVIVLMIFASVIMACLCTRHQARPAIFQEIHGSGEDINMSSIEAGDDDPKYGIDNPDKTTTEDEKSKSKFRKNGAVQKASSKKSTSKENGDDWNRLSQVSGVEYAELDVEDVLSAVDNIRDDQDGDETTGTEEEKTDQKKEKADEMTADATKDVAKEPQPSPSGSTQEVAANIPGSEPDATSKDDEDKIADEKPAKEIPREPTRRAPTLQDGVTTPHEEHADGLGPNRIPDQMHVTKATDTMADNTATVNENDEAADHSEQTSDVDQSKPVVSPKPGRTQPTKNSAAALLANVITQGRRPAADA